MARSASIQASQQYLRNAPAKAPVRRKKKSRSLGFNIALGVGLTVATLMGASMLTVATSVKSASSVRFETALLSPLPSKLQPPQAASRELDVSKFSRLAGSNPADPKAARLAGAEFAALSALRPTQDNVRASLSAALSAAKQDADNAQQFAALEKIRPDAEAIKSILGPAMASLVVVAPRGDDDANGMPDMLQDVQPATQVAELKDMKPVEMAALEDGTDQEDGDDQMDVVAEDDVPVPSPAPQIAEAPSAASTLPMAGPVPVFRPGAAIAMAKPDDGAAKPNALAAIAAVAPQKPGKADNDDKPTVLAFAKPDNPMRDDAPSRPAPSAPNWPGLGTKVAVFDITNGVVHMPNGTELEAHSGIGNMRDNPSFTHVKMRGPTPPGTYKLSMRESLFHGVAAIRLTPVDGKAPLGRTGLLAHSYLLRSRLGDSHGCVAFAQYDRFLKAFQRGEITHLVIVPKWDGKRPGRGPSNGGFLAKLFGGNDA